jgi:uncharacterized protein
MMHKVNIAGVMLDQASKTPIVVLKNLDDDKSIPIWLGITEASAIASAIQNIKFDRPMTHDLFKNFISLLNVAVSKVELTDIKNKTCYSKIYFNSKEQIFQMDARPSDAIALALRFNAPIFVDEKIFEKSKPILNTKTSNINGALNEEKLSKYLKNLPEQAFGKYKI